MGNVDVWMQFSERLLSRTLQALSFFCCNEGKLFRCFEVKSKCDVGKVHAVYLIHHRGRAGAARARGRAVTLGGIWS